MAWATENGFAVFTRDLDFGTTLALTAAVGPSVIQVRGAYVMPEDIGSVVMAAIGQHHDAISAGALIVVDPAKIRVRLLPLSRDA